MIKKIFSLLNDHFGKICVGVFLLFTICSILTGNLLSVIHNCFDVYDLGIYHQAIVELGIDNLNPYLSVRGLKIFNDHFDPILLLAAFFVHIFGSSPEVTIIFEFLWYLTFLFLLVGAVIGENLGEKKEIIVNRILFIVGITVFTRGMLTGILFPIHPTFWSIVPFFFICKYVKRENIKGIFISSLALCFFKEIFAPALIFFSLYYAFEKNWKFFFPLFLLGVIGCIFNFYLRPLWLGTIFPWDSHVLSENPLEKFFVNTLIHGDYESAFRLLYPFIIPFFLLYREEIKKKGFKHFSIPIFFLVTPLFGLHFINGELWFQYAATTLGPLLAILALSSIPKKIVKNRKLLLITCFLFFINGLNKHRSQWGIIARVLGDLTGTHYMEKLLEPYEYCSLTKKHRHAIKEVQKFIEQQPVDKKILSTGGVIPRIISPKRLIYSLAGHSEPQPFYDIFLFEKNNSENYIYRMQRIRTIKIKASCEEFVRRVYIDNEFYYLAEGKFPSACL